MTIEALGALANALPLTQMTAAGVGAPIGVRASPGVFDNLVQSMQELNSQMAANQQAVESLATGQGDDLHRVIMNLESTKLQFDLALQVRNKVLDAYQELMRMQI